jgi:N6-adenosine-specific RNA methylase IME4
VDYALFEDVPNGTYDVVYTDPPWRYTGDPNKWGAAEKEYPTMSDAEIAALPIREKLRKRGVLFMWATSPRLDVAFKTIDAWNLYYRGVAFIWAKTRKDGKLIGAQGVRPSIVKPTAELVLAASTERDDETAELVLAASTVKSGRPISPLDEGVAQMVLAPRGRHSEKPEEVRRRIERLYGPDIRRLEMFARGEAPVEPWDRFGDDLTPRGETILELLDGSGGNRTREAR